MKLASILLSTALCGGALMAQTTTPTAPQPKVPDALVQYLSLSETQTAALLTARQAFHDAVQSVQEQIRLKQQDLKTEMANDAPNAGVVGQLLVDIKNLQKSVEAERTKFVTAASQGLTDSQKAALTALQEAMKLVPAARAAAGFGLITPPEGDGGPGMGAGPGAVFGPGPGGPGRPGGPGGRR